MQNELLVVNSTQLLEKEHSGCRALLRDDKVLYTVALFHCLDFTGISPIPSGMKVMHGE